MITHEQGKGKRGPSDKHAPERGWKKPNETVADQTRFLNPVELDRLEKAFRDWTNDNSRLDFNWSRKRILLVFLLIRYTGAKLNEVLRLNPSRDIDVNHRLILFRKSAGSSGRLSRKIEISEAFSSEIRTLLNDPFLKKALARLFQVDPAHVRRKFYDRAEACGFVKKLGSPDAIRKARAAELLQNNMPLPVVQKILGHSTPNLTSSFVSLTEEDIHAATFSFLQKEARRKTSARNIFLGKIRSIQKGDIQSRVDMATLGGFSITTIITNDSLRRLGLKPGRRVSAEIKAPWVMLFKTLKSPEVSAENRFQGTVIRVHKGRITTELVVRIADDTELCSLVSNGMNEGIEFKEGESVWAAFSSFSVVLHVD
jgi:molybdate transport system regulatory protein